MSAKEQIKDIQGGTEKLSENNSENPKKIIDIEAILKESGSSFFKRLPRFAIWLIQRLLKESELNYILSKYADCEGVSFHDKVIEELNLNVQIEGLENLPESSRCFFVANHPFGIIDGLILTHTVAHKHGTFRAIGNEAFLYIPNLKPFIAAVNVYGRTSKEYIEALEKVYQSDIPITHFPAGEVSRIYNFKAQDSAWQKSFISKAISCKRDIVPFRFYGRNSILFYSVFIIRKMFGIKINLELALLSREFFKKKNKTIRVQIKKPITWQELSKEHTHQAWAKKIRSYVYN
jgi:putative hemolysin